VEFRLNRQKNKMGKGVEEGRKRKMYHRCWWELLMQEEQVEQERLAWRWHRVGGFQVQSAGCVSLYYSFLPATSVSALPIPPSQPFPSSSFYLPTFCSNVDLISLSLSLSLSLFSLCNQFGLLTNTKIK
jgi:hypothetical protein